MTENRIWDQPFRDLVGRLTETAGQVGAGLASSDEEDRLTQEVVAEYERALSLLWTVWEWGGSVEGGKPYYDICKFLGKPPEE